MDDRDNHNIYPHGKMAAESTENKSLKFQKHFLHLSYKDAKKMAHTKYSCLEEVQHQMRISLPPKFIGNLPLGLKEEMNRVLFAYQHKLAGVPLAYDKIQIKASQIIDDQEFINLEVNVLMVVFKPEISKILHGVVNKIGDHHYGCLFHNCINGSVRKPHESHLSDDQREVLSSLSLGDEIFTKITKIDSHHEVLFVMGEVANQNFHQSIRKNSICSTENDVANESQKRSNKEILPVDTEKLDKDTTKSPSKLDKDTTKSPSKLDKDTTKSPSKKKKEKKHKLKKVKSLTNGHTEIKTEPESDFESSSPKKKKKKKAVS